MKSPLAEQTRERLVLAMLPDVAFDGWTRHTLRQAARRLAVPEAEAMALFGRGAADMIATFSRWADRQMSERLVRLPDQPSRLSERVALALRLRLEVLLPWREAVRRGLSLLALPHNAPLGLRLLYDTVDAVWRAVGDDATDFSFYTKRASLAAIQAGAVLYWLDDGSPGFADTQAFIARRLGDLHRFGGLRQRLSEAADRLPKPMRLLRP